MGFAAVLTAASVGMQALGSIYQGEAQAKADKANAAIAENNAKISLQNASYAGAEGAQQAETQGLRNRATMASIKANQGASGVDVNKGSAPNVRASQAMLGQEDVLNIKANAARTAYGYQTEATGYNNQASIDRSSAKNARTAGYMNAISGATSKIGAYALANGGSPNPTGGGSLLTGNGNVDNYAPYVASNSLNSSGFQYDLYGRERTY